MLKGLILQKIAFDVCVCMLLLLFLYNICVHRDWFCELTWKKVYEKSFEVNLVVLRWPSAVDRTLESSDELTSCCYLVCAHCTKTKAHIVGVHCTETKAHTVGEERVTKRSVTDHFYWHAWKMWVYNYSNQCLAIWLSNQPSGHLDMGETLTLQICQKSLQHCNFARNHKYLLYSYDHLSSASSQDGNYCTILCFWADPLCSSHMWLSEWRLDLCSTFQMSTEVVTVLFSCWHAWCHVKLLCLSACSVYTIQPCTSLWCHFVQSHIGRVHAYLAVTCHLHFWHNDWDLLCAAAVTWGWNGHKNKSQHSMFTLEGEMFPLLLLRLKPRTFCSRVQCSTTTELSPLPIIW